MQYAKVAVALPVEGPFDYLIPPQIGAKVEAGSRVRVVFGHRKLVGYCVGTKRKSGIKNVRPILELIDDNALLDTQMLRLTKELSGYYCCSWGEAIEVTLPPPLREGKRISLSCNPTKGGEADQRKKNIALLHQPDRELRWGIYLEHIKSALAADEPVIILLPDRESLLDAKDRVYAQLGIMPVLLCRNQPGELQSWCAIRTNQARIIMGIRSAVFAPARRPGLIIMEEEESFAYKQDQAPHYNAGEAALMRSEIGGCDIIFGSASPSLEKLYLARQNKINYLGPGQGLRFPEIKILDTGSYRNFTKKKKVIFSKFLEDAIFSALNSGEKVLLFLNRKGFATQAACGNCGLALKCPRCSINLVYHLKDERGVLRCHYCNFRMQVPNICPSCNAGYIKYSGSGIEKIESEISLLFPSAKTKRVEADEELNLSTADIFIATSAIIKKTGAKFGLIGVLGTDNSLNYPSLRASERTFALLVALLRLTDKRMLIETALPAHHCFQSLLKGDFNIFYDEELKQRRELRFPPYRHLVLLKLRGKKEERVKKEAGYLFEKLNKSKNAKGLSVLSLNPGNPPKLRDNFYWQILLSCQSPYRASKFLKFNLKDFRHSGIIVTVDVDPL